MPLPGYQASQANIKVCSQTVISSQHFVIPFK